MPQRAARLRVALQGHDRRRLLRGPSADSTPPYGERGVGRRALRNGACPGAAYLHGRRLDRSLRRCADVAALPGRERQRRSTLI